MVILKDLQKIRDGLVLESGVLNNNFSSRVIKNQPVAINVKIGSCVYFNSEYDKWVVSANNVPQGIYYGHGIVITYGKCDIFSGLISGVFYYMAKDGSLTDSILKSYNKIKIGFAADTTTLFVDIGIVGENT